MSDIRLSLRIFVAFVFSYLAVTVFFVSIRYGPRGILDNFGYVIVVTFAYAFGLLLVLSLWIALRTGVRYRRQTKIKRLLQQFEGEPDGAKSLFFEVDDLLRLTADLDGRIAEWRRLAKRFAGCVWPLHYVGRALSEAEAHSEAVSLLRQAHRVEPDDTDIQLALARALLRSRDYAGSVEEYRHFIDMSPQNISIVPEFIQALLAAGEIDAARQEAAFYRLAGGQLSPMLEEQINAKESGGSETA